MINFIMSDSIMSDSSIKLVLVVRIEFLPSSCCVCIDSDQPGRRSAVCEAVVDITAC